jgi:hypothetical protein
MRQCVSHRRRDARKPTMDTAVTATATASVILTLGETHAGVGIRSPANTSSHGESGASTTYDYRRFHEEPYAA